jgi:DNA-binding protein H-NS
MRKLRDFDAELKALDDKANELKARKVQQLGELVIATGADCLGPEELAGALIALAETKDRTKRESWAKRGATFYDGRSRRPRQSQRPAQKADRDTGSTQAQPGSPQSASGRTGAA